MRRRDSTAPDAWFALARADLRTAQVLLEADEPTFVGFHLHQAAEKGIKGFLLAHGSDPPRTHDLDELLDDAEAFHEPLSEHRELCSKMTRFHTTQRYPGEQPDLLAPEEFEEMLAEVVAMLDELEAASASR